MATLEGRLWKDSRMTRGFLALLLLLLAYHRSQPLPIFEPSPLPLSELSTSDLRLISGIGPVMADRLKSTHEKELTSVHGVGEKLASKWSPYFSLHRP